MNPVSPVSPNAAGAVAHAAAPRDARADKVRHAATEFESMLLKQLLKSAKLGGSSQGENSSGYADMAVDAMSSAVERGGGLGLAAQIERAVIGTTGTHAGTPPAGHKRSG